MKAIPLHIYCEVISFMSWRTWNMSSRCWETSLGREGTPDPERRRDSVADALAPRERPAAAAADPYDRRRVPGTLRRPRVGAGSDADRPVGLEGRGGRAFRGRIGTLTRFEESRAPFDQMDLRGGPPGRRSTTFVSCRSGRSRREGSGPDGSTLRMSGRSEWLPSTRSRIVATSLSARWTPATRRRCSGCSRTSR